MLIDVLRPEMWEELNDRLKSHLLLPAKTNARGYRGLSQAVFEIAQGTAHFMSHKKAIGVILGQSPAFELLLPYYYKETYQVQTITHDKLTNTAEWAQGLLKETNFVLVAEDHPVTGELYPFVDELDRLLNEKRILVIRVSHARHFYENIEIRPYTVRICSFNSFHAVALTGERFRSPPLAAQSMDWSGEDFIAELARSREGRKVDEKAVIAFEDQVGTVAKPWFKSGALRLMDRAVCSFADVSGEAVVNVLQKKLGIDDEEALNVLSTTNLCQWDAVKMFRHWWQPTPSIEQLRGLMVISPVLLDVKDFAKHFVSAYEEVKQLQSWKV